MLPLKLLTSMYNFNPHPHVEGDSYIWYLLLRNVAYIESYTTLFS